MPFEFSFDCRTTDKIIIDLEYGTEKFEHCTLEKLPAEKIESPPGKRKIIL